MCKGMSALFISLFVSIGNAQVFGPPKVNSVSLEKTLEENHKIDMGTTHFTGRLFEYLVVRIDKRGNELLELKDIQENLAYCSVVHIKQSLSSLVADVMVTFEVENDGGFNSCKVHFVKAEKNYFLELFAEVGE